MVNVSNLRRQPGTSQREHRSGRMGGLRMPHSEVPEDSEVTVDALLEAATGGVVVLADVEAPWRGECRRCLGEARGKLEVQVRELYSPDSDPELCYPLPGDQLDLGPLVRDAVLLDLPQAPLCRADCRGLCPVCGVDRNSEGCDCVEPAADPRWAGLDILR